MSTIAWGVLALILTALSGNWGQILPAVAGFALLGVILTILVALLTNRRASFPALA